MRDHWERERERERERGMGDIGELIKRKIQKWANMLSKIYLKKKKKNLR